MQNNKFKRIKKEQTTITRIGGFIYIYEFMWSKGVRE